MPVVKKYKIKPIQHTGVGGLIFNHGDIAREDQLNNPSLDLENGYIEPFNVDVKKEPSGIKEPRKKAGKPKSDKTKNK